MAKKTVMIVDDEADILDLLTAMIGQRYRVMRANSAIDALEQLGNKKPDLILLDICLPDIDGWELLEKIRKNVHLKNIPVAMLTASKPETEKGVDGYITKPVTRTKLLESIEKIFKNRAIE